MLKTNSSRIRTGIILTALLALWGAGRSVAATPDGFLRTEREVLGEDAMRTWRGLTIYQQIGGEGRDRRPDEFGGGAADDEDDGGPKNVGRKVRAGLLSAVLPGAGQFYNGKQERAYIMGGIEVAIWTAFFVFDRHGDNSMENAREWAGIYAGTTGDHPDTYWQNVGFFMDSDAYYESLLREARALQEPAPDPLAANEAWQWVNEDRRYGYAKLRADGNSAYDRRDFMILFAVLNRTVSVVDAVIGAGAGDGTLRAEVLGLDLQLAVDPGFATPTGTPGARCVVSRSF